MITVGDLFLCFEPTLHMCSRKVYKGNFHCKSKFNFFMFKRNLALYFRRASVHFECFFLFFNRNNEKFINKKKKNLISPLKRRCRRGNC